MAVQIKVYSDYVCPYCFLAEGLLDAAIQGKDVKVEWMPFELRPYPIPSLRPEGGYLQRAWKESVYPLAATMGVKLTLPNVSPQPHTRLAFEGFQYAREHGKAAEYNHRMFTAFFQESLDIGDPGVLAQLAGEIGLDAEDFRSALESGKYGKAHEKALYKACVEAGIQSVPTFVVGGQVLNGLPPKEALEAAIAEAQQG